MQAFITNAGKKRMMHYMYAEELQENLEQVTARVEALSDEDANAMLLNWLYFLAGNDCNAFNPNGERSMNGKTIHALARRLAAKIGGDGALVNEVYEAELEALIERRAAAAKDGSHDAEIAALSLACVQHRNAELDAAIEKYLQVEPGRISGIQSKADRDNLNRPAPNHPGSGNVDLDDDDEDEDEPSVPRLSLRAKKAAKTSRPLPATPTEAIGLVLEASDHGQFNADFIKQYGYFAPVRSALTEVLTWLAYDHKRLKYQPFVPPKPAVEQPKLAPINEQLARFYSVDSDQELINVQAGSIRKLQEKLARLEQAPAAPRRPRG